jgi:8-oxo-dGTP pyrophosphatase MutT (NUDIX family)
MIPPDAPQPVREVSAAVIQRADGRILLLQRGPTAPTFPNRWGLVTGLVEPGETPAQAARREMSEEIGLAGQIVRAGEPFTVDIGAFVARVWPFLCAIDPTAPITLADENQRAEWVTIGEVFRRETIPRIDQDFRALGLIE